MCMSKENALKAILGISSAGVLFSGCLSFYELFSKTCPVGGCSNLLGIPVCVYGLMMYTAILVIAAMGLKGEAKKRKK